MTTESKSIFRTPLKWDLFDDDETQTNKRSDFVRQAQAGVSKDLGFLSSLSICGGDFGHAADSAISRIQQANKHLNDGHEAFNEKGESLKGRLDTFGNDVRTSNVDFSPISAENPQNQQSRQSLTDSFCVLPEGEEFCVGNLGIDRSKMPQISNVQKGEFLQTYGDKVEIKEVDANSLHSTQSDLSAGKVHGMVKEARKRGRNPCNVSIITALGPENDLRVVNGHHRAAACSLLNGKMKIEHIQSPIEKVIHQANTFISINNIIGGDSSKARKIGEIESLGLSLVPTNSAGMYYRYQHLSNLLEDFSQEEQQTIMRYYRENQTETATRASVMDRMITLWSVKQAFNGLDYTLSKGVQLLRKSREMTCKIPGINQVCKLEDFAHDLTVTSAKATYNAGKVFVNFAYQYDLNFQIAVKTARKGGEIFRFCGEKYSELAEHTAHKLWVHYDIPPDFTRDSFHGAELIAMHHGLKWASSSLKVPRNALVHAEEKELGKSLRLYEELSNPLRLEQNSTQAYNVERIRLDNELFDIFKERHKDATIMSAGKLEIEDLGFNGVEVAMGNKFFTSDTAVFLIEHIETNQKTWSSSLSRLQEVAREEGCQFVEIIGEFVEQKLSRDLKKEVIKGYDGKVVFSRKQLNANGSIELDTTGVHFPVKRRSFEE